MANTYPAAQTFPIERCIRAGFHINGLAMRSDIEVLTSHRSTTQMSHRRVTLCGALFVSLGPVSLGLFTPAMTSIATDFSVDKAWVQASLILYVAGFSFAQLVSGPLSDGFGRRRVLIAFIGIYLLGSIIGVLSPSIEMVLIGRLAQGIGAAAGVTILRAVVRDLFTGKAAAEILGSIGTMLAISPAIAPVVGALSVEALGWRGVFMAMSLVGIVLIAVAAVVLAETHPRSRRRRPSPLHVARVYVELLTTSRVFVAAVTAACSIGGIYMFAAFMPFVLIQYAGLSTLQFGLVMLIPSSFYVVAALITKRLLHTRAHETLILPGLGILLLASSGLSLVLFLGPPNALLIIVPTAFFSFALPLITPAITVQAMEGRAEQGGAAAAVLGFFQFGGGFAFAVIGMGFPSPVMAVAVLPVVMSLIAILAQVLMSRRRLQTITPLEIA